MRIVISKFLTEMSWSKESFSRMAVLAFSASRGSPAIKRVSRESTTVIRREAVCQSRNERLTGFSSSWPHAYFSYARQEWTISSRTRRASSARSNIGAGGDVARHEIAGASATKRKTMEAPLFTAPPSLLRGRLRGDALLHLL